MKKPPDIPKNERDRIKKVLKKETLSDLDLNCYDRLREYLKREPTDTELGNMRTDTNLLTWVLTEQ